MAFRAQLMDCIDMRAHLRSLTFVVAAMFGCLQTVTALLTDSQVGPPHKLLLADARINPSLSLIWGYSLKDPIQCAADNGHCEIVRMLMKDSPVNLCLSKGYKLQMYCRAGDLQLVQEFLTDPCFTESRVCVFFSLWGRRYGKCTKDVG